ATCAAPPSAYQRPTGEAAPARTASPSATATRIDAAADRDGVTGVRSEVSLVLGRSIASPLHQRAADEPHHRLLGDRLLDGLRVRVPVAVHRPEDGRLDQQPGGDGGGRKRSQDLPVCPILEISREKLDEPVAGAVEPQGGELRVVAGRSVEQLDPPPV